MNDAPDLRTTFRHGNSEAVRRMAEVEVERSRASGDLAGEVEALYALARVALRAENSEEAGRLAQQALDVAHRAGDQRLEERPRHVLAAIARLSGDHERARDLYEVSIERNRALGLEEHVHSEYHNLALSELHLGNAERARQLFTESRERVFRAGYMDFLPYLGLAAAALASADGDLTQAARLIGFTDQAFKGIDQVPDPDDALELDAMRSRVAAALGQEIFESHPAAGARWTPLEAFGRTWS